MASLLSRIATLLQQWLGLTAPSGTSLTPAHGWLLPDPGALAGLRLARVTVPVVRGPRR